MKNILFVCVENSCRSQMAEAFAKMHGADVVHAYSAGSQASGIVNPRAIAAMQRIGYDLTPHLSKKIEALPEQTFDYVVTMGCGDDCPYVPTINREDWQIPDPKNMPDKEFDRVRDIIEAEVKALLQQIQE